jgi:hypothetical protein
VKDAPDDDTWAFFARNWGNEGFCSRYFHVLPLETVAIRIPWRCGATAVALGNGTVVKKSPGVPSNPRITWAPSEGVVVSSICRDPIRDLVSFRVSTGLHLAWTMSGTCAQVTAPRPQRRPVPSPGEELRRETAGGAGAPAVAVELAAVGRTLASPPPC